MTGSIDEENWNASEVAGNKTVHCVYNEVVNHSLLLNTSA